MIALFYPVLKEFFKNISPFISMKLNPPRTVPLGVSLCVINKRLALERREAGWQKKGCFLYFGGTHSLMCPTKRRL